MSSNKFLISDASYCYQSKKARLAVIDTSTHKKYTKTANNPIPFEWELSA